jgi:hypothetical protein
MTTDRTAHKPSPARSCHRLGPSDMPLEAKRSRHVAVVIPQVRISRGITASACQQFAAASFPLRTLDATPGNPRPVL